jgi:hypothetical protein
MTDVALEDPSESSFLVLGRCPEMTMKNSPHEWIVKGAIRKPVLAWFEWYR